VGLWRSAAPPRDALHVAVVGRAGRPIAHGWGRAQMVGGRRHGLGDGGASLFQKSFFSTRASFSLYAAISQRPTTEPSMPCHTRNVMASRLPFCSMSATTKAFSSGRAQAEDTVRARHSGDRRQDGKTVVGDDACDVLAHQPAVFVWTAKRLHSHTLPGPGQGGSQKKKSGWQETQHGSYGRPGWGGKQFRRSKIGPEHALARAQGWVDLPAHRGSP